MQLKEIYQIPPDKQIQLSTYDNNEILAYGIKIAELILLNPHKYKKLQIVHSFGVGKYNSNNYEQSSLIHKEVPKIEYDGTISRYSDDNNKNNNSSNANDGSKYHNHKRNYNMTINKENLPSTYRTNNNGNNFYYENKTYDEHNNSSNNNMVNDELKNTNESIKYNNEQQQRLNYYTNNNNNNNNVTNTNRSNSLNYYSHTPMNNYNRSFNYKYSRITNQNNNNNNNTSTNININHSDNEELLYNNIDIHPRPNTSSNFHSHWNNLNSPHI